MVAKLADLTTCVALILYYKSPVPCASHALQRALEGIQPHAALLLAACDPGVPAPLVVDHHQRVLRLQIGEVSGDHEGLGILLLCALHL